MGFIQKFLSFTAHRYTRVAAGYDVQALLLPAGHHHGLSCRWWMRVRLKGELGRPAGDPLICLLSTSIKHLLCKAGAWECVLGLLAPGAAIYWRKLRPWSQGLASGNPACISGFLSLAPVFSSKGFSGTSKFSGACSLLGVFWGIAYSQASVSWSCNATLLRGKFFLWLREEPYDLQQQKAALRDDSQAPSMPCTPAEALA